MAAFGEQHPTPVGHVPAQSHKRSYGLRPATVVLTQEAYDALESPDPEVLYLISEPPA